MNRSQSALNLDEWSGSDRVARERVMQTQTTNRASNFIRYLYDHGFSLLALLLTVIAFAFSDTYPEQLRQQRMIGDKSENSAQASRIWRAEGNEWLTQRATEMTQMLKDNGIAQVTVYSRVKAEESAREKAARKGIDIFELNDLYGMRVVVANELDVYQCLNLICGRYEIVPGTIKNYIVSPKASGYQSVHVVAKVEDRRVEFQLRTESMHQSAEAEHEAYKARMRMAA